MKLLPRGIIIRGVYTLYALEKEDDAFGCQYFNR